MARLRIKPELAMDTRSIPIAILITDEEIRNISASGSFKPWITYSGYWVDVEHYGGLEVYERTHVYVYARHKRSDLHIGHYLRIPADYVYSSSPKDLVNEVLDNKYAAS